MSLNKYNEIVNLNVGWSFGPQSPVQVIYQELRYVNRLFSIIMD